MCVDQNGEGSQGTFDPTRCPLLQGLSSEEADRMMASDRRIRACMGAIATGSTRDLEPCVAEMVKTHETLGRTRRRSTPRVA